MGDYEDMILSRQEDEYDECAGCIYAKDNGKGCRNQCMEIEVHHNPQLEAMKRKNQRYEG